MKMRSVLSTLITIYSLLLCNSTLSDSFGRKNSALNDHYDANHSDETGELLLSYQVERLANNHHNIPINSNVLRFDENQKIFLNCFFKTITAYLDLKLKWRVYRYDLESEVLSQGTDITMIFTPNRDDHGLTVSCIGTSEYYPKSYYNRTVTLINYAEQTKLNKNERATTDTYLLEIGSALIPSLSHCILISKDSITKYDKTTKALITKVGMEHNGSSTACAKFEHKSKTLSSSSTRNSFELIVQKTLILVIPKAGNVSPVVGNDTDYQITMPDADQPTSTTYEPDKSGETEPSFPIKEIVGGTVAFITVLIIVFIVLKLLKKRKDRQKLNEHVYPEPLVLYAEIQANEHGPIPKKEERPYAIIKGVVVPKKRQIPNKIPSPPPRNKPHTTHAQSNYQAPIESARDRTDLETRKEVGNTLGESNRERDTQRETGDARNNKETKNTKEGVNSRVMYSQVTRTENHRENSIYCKT